MRYDPIMCMMVDDSVKTEDELSLAQKKQVVTELKGFLKKSYNFSDESEYARAYEDIRQMFTTGSRKSISGLFENAVKKTGSHDSIETEDASWKAWTLYIDGKFVKSFNSEMPPIKEAKEFMKENYPNKVAKLSRNTGSSSGYVISSRDSNIIDHAIRSCDEDKDRYEVVKIGEFLYGIYDNIKKKVVIESTKTGIESYSKMFNAKNLNNPRKI